MATKKRTFFNTPWNERSALEKGVIVVGGSIVAWNVWKYLIKPALAQQSQNPAFPPLTNFYLPGGTPGATPGGVPGATSAVTYDPRPLVDKIAESIIGSNLFVYPEIVNQLSKLTKAELQIAYNYWAQTYQNQTGNSLTAQIEGEWGSGTTYAAALGALKGAGLFEGNREPVFIPRSLMYLPAIGKLQSAGLY